MRRLVFALLAVTAVFLALGPAQAYQALQGPTEMRYWDSARADNGYTLFGVSGTTYLVDMEGRVVHTWPVGTNPHLLDNGTILDALTDDPSGFGGFKEVDWNGSTVWQHTETRSTYHPHHDFTRIFNPKLNAYTTLYIANKDFTQAQLIAAGSNPATTPSTGAQMDAIVEVDSSGNVVWEWCFYDHVIQDFDSSKPNYVGSGKTIADYPGRLNINLTGHALKSDWLHCNSLDYNQALDQVVINSVQGEFYVIDHGNTFVAGNPTASIALAATSAGDFLYRFGDAARYSQGTTPAVMQDWTQSTSGTKQLGGAHGIQWIKDGLVGAGHFLIFNNAEYLSERTAQSYVMEINPYLDASGADTGHYVNPPDAGYTTPAWPSVCAKEPRLVSKQVVWNYASRSPSALFSHIGCSAQRLANGNTLICADTYGYVTEVTPDDQTVWDYIVPVIKSGAVLQIGDCLPMTNSIFRAYRYKATDPALAGRTLTPGNTIAGRSTVTNPYAGSSYTALQRPTEVQYWDSSNAYNGYTLFGAQGTSYLIDMQGRLVKTWPLGTNPRLLDSGHLLDSDGSSAIKELDWSGSTVWQHAESRSAYHPHSDFARIYNPKLGAYTTLYLAAKDLTPAQCITAGCDPADGPYDGAQADTITEVDSSGDVIWEWCFFDHGVQNVDSTKANYASSISSYPGKINLNMPGRPVSSGWPNCNSIDYNQSLDQIVINTEPGEFYVIDHGNTFNAGNPTASIALAASSAGDFLYRFGDPARYEQGSAPSVKTNWEDATTGNKQIGASNDVHWISTGSPGAGHLMVFSNNQYLFQRTPQSYVFEINPYLNSAGTDTGDYVDPPAADYTTWTFEKDTMKASQLLSKQVVWKYGTLSNLTLFSPFGSSAQRLPNGNTLICAASKGYMVEVTSDGTVAWEYINPVTASGVVSAIGDEWPMTNAALRAYRYPSSFAGFAGHDLTATSTIAGNTPPLITGTTLSPLRPTASDSPCVTSTVTDDGRVSGVTLSYSAGGGATEQTAFQETMCATAVRPWAGSGADNSWTITGSYIEQRTASNYGSGNACGMEYKGGSTLNALASAMITTTDGISAAGTSGYVEFYIQTLTLESTDGWTFQTDSGSGYVTRLSELTGSSHGWQKYHYDLSTNELVSGLKMRFQFTGGGASDTDRIDLDQIVVKITSGIAPGTITMYDDGVHGDGAAADGVYGGQIPAMPLGTTVSYYVTATDSIGLASVDPASAPTSTYSYTVSESFFQDVMLGRPTDSSIALSLLANQAVDAYVQYGTATGAYSGQSSTGSAAANTPYNFEITGLQPDTQYYYRVQYRRSGESTYTAGTEHVFHTQRAAGSSFVFDVQADLHYMDNSPSVYTAAAGNMLADQPDFVMDLGDTFMGEKFGVATQSGVTETAKNTRLSLLNQIGHSAPIFFATGNHDQELGWLLSDTTPQSNIAVWATQARQLYYPCPAPGDFYSGSEITDTYTQSVRDSYYSFNWGDALIIVLDPFWYTTSKPANSDNGWGWTLGRDQYDWLKQTLETSQAKYRFVFIHHLAGGSFDGVARGGVEFARYFEWGGDNADGTPGFETQRPDWPMPIQDLLIANGVSIVFHGHDHFFAKQDLDADGDSNTDLVYLECPQPSSQLYTSADTAASYGYVNGDIISNSGHVRVSVSSDQATIEYIRAYALGDQTGSRVNGAIAHTFSVMPNTTDLTFNGNIILGRPTSSSVTASVLSNDRDLDVRFRVGTQSGSYTTQTSTYTLTAGTPREIVLSGLQANTKYYYRMDYAAPGGSTFFLGAEHSFRTQRSAGSTFSFVIEADPHLYDIKGNSDLYQITLRNQAADSPDFMIDLGDTFGDDHDVNLSYADMLQLHADYRPYLGSVCNSVPFFFVLGNHEGECGAYMDGTADNLAVRATLARKLYYPNPVPDGFYTGNTEVEPLVGAPQNYYAWTWGDALFVVLDAYRYTTVSPKPTDLWDWTLGQAQYSWLKQTLENSSAKYKFVFAHHVLGQTRGGVNWAGKFEWGGKNNDGTTWGFDSHRSGWAKPVHQLMADNDVTIFFQGHDHLYAREELDGVIYQEVPMPSDATYNVGAENASYYTGTVLSNTGHLKVTVSPSGAKVDYIKAYLPADATAEHPNGEVAYSYTADPAVPPTPREVEDGQPITLAQEVVTANFGSFFYIEDSTRAWGIRVDGSGPAVGILVTASGTVQTIDGERRIAAATVTNGDAGTVPAALGMPGKLMGGGTNGYVPGVAGGYGLNNIGLLVKLYGKVSAVDPANAWFRINDGSLSLPVKVLLPGGVTPPDLGAFVSAVGISSCEVVGSESQRLLRLRDSGDITLLQSAPVEQTPVPDTGQLGDYSTIFGEDSDYSINPPTYRDNGDGTVTDRVTGLMWQHTDGGEMTWEQAVSYASGLSLAGHDDWRLPTANELYYIVDEGTVNPAMDTRYFPATLAEYWWTSEQRVDDSTKAWAVNAGGGIGAHPKTETISAGGTKHFHVRCVRGAAASAISPSLTNNGDGTVTDNRTGLVWQQAEVSAKTWEQALAYAESLSLAGHDDWRLPNIKELRSINDDSLHGPSANTTYFPGAQAVRYWSSTTLVQDPTKAWYMDADYGLTTYDIKSASCYVRCVRGGTQTVLVTPELKLIPGGSFSMGDHFNYNDPEHPSDELPLHTVSIDTFYLGKFDVTNSEYCDYLNSALAQGLIEVRDGLIHMNGGSDILCETRSSTLYGTPYSGIVWDGSVFSVLSGRDDHPMVGVRWEGAAAYCNWLSAAQGYEQCYDLSAWTCDLAKNGYRLPTEAEWEYAANGGRYYYMFPWGDDPNTVGLLANWDRSGDPYESGDYPWTTPVGFYNGQLHQKADFGWPGSQASYQTSDGVNGYGLYDMAGNVWQWTNDWYGKDYYSVSPSSNPRGPTTGDNMPDGKAYHVLRGGNWYNGAEYYGHSRIANRDPGYYRGPQDPNHPYYHVGFRVALATSSVTEPGASLTLLTSGLQFGEGPAADAAGNVFFSDVFADTIYKWSLAGQMSTFRTNTGGANGLAFDSVGNLLACEADNGRVTSTSADGTAAPVASLYGGVRFNEPNDLWVDPKGGVYFTDPVFWGSVTQGGQHVYYINTARTAVTRVISDMVKPNGIVGTPDGSALYVSDYGAGNTYRYTVNSGGSLSGKTLFVAAGSDGMEIDDDGNVYLTTDDVMAYSASGELLQQINIPDRPTNLCFGGSDRRTLFITTEHALYSIPMSVRGTTLTAVNTPPTITGTTRTPSAPSSTTPVWVTSTITDNGAVASAKLTYLVGNATPTENTALLETMCATAVKPWTGSGAQNAWTVTGNYFEQRTGSNYGTGNVCGVQFKSGATPNPLTSAMIATTNGINTAGISGYVEFYIQTLALDGTDGWTFQTDSGSGYTTRLSELTGSSHGWQKFHYDFAASELVNGLKMRFQFTGGGAGDDDRIDLDQILVKVTAGSVPVQVAMSDDGAHGDGASGDHVYGGQIPAMPNATSVGYYVTATDDAGLSSTDPADAPSGKYSYIVGRTTPQLVINEFMTDAATFVSSPDYPARTVGLFVNSAEAFPGYTIVDPMHNKTTYLIDNTGQVVNSWTSAYEPGRSAYLKPNGHLIRACMAPGGLSTGGGEGGRIEERDWDGNLVWYIDYATSNYMMHHDFKVLPNGNIVMLVAEKRTYAQALAAGFSPSLLDSSISTSGYMLPDSVVEIQPTYPSGGTVVWEWHIWDHMVQDYDSSKSNYGVVSQHPELVDSNGTGIKIPQFWNHVNGIDYNPEFDQIMLSARNHCEVWVIDHSTTTAQAAGHTGGARGKGGDLLYRWGNPQQYDMGTSADQKLFHEHDTQWIGAGCPGAGDILVYNNGLTRPAGAYSTIDQITPPVDALGNYSRSAGSAYGPSGLTWTYVASPPTSFYSAEISGALRLPNGNTLICEGNNGRLFEVTAGGTTVWQYQCPVGFDGILAQGDSLPVDPRGGLMTAVFKAQRYPLDYAAFAGRTLTQNGAVELYPDWVEIRNPGTSAVDMGGMYLTNDLSNKTKWQIPSGVSIPAGGCLLFWADGMTSKGSRHTSFTLDSAGGSIGLYDIDGATPVDSVSYGSQITDISTGRYPDTTGAWSLMLSPTPGTANSGQIELPSVPVKQVPDGTLISLPELVVTAVFDSFFYVEAADRSYGIRVDQRSHGASVGSKARIIGWVRTNSGGERYIEAIDVTVSGNGAVNPLGMPNKSLGGGQSGYQAAVAPGGSGASNIGLLVRTWGKVTGMDSVSSPSWVTIDDGSGLDLRCLLPTAFSWDSNWQWITVTGISSCESAGGEVHRLLRIRSQDDVQGLDDVLKF